MLVLEIIMIVIGIGAVVLSFRLSDKSSNSEVKERVIGLSEREQQELLEKGRQKIINMAEDISLETEDKLSELSNEKIMGFSEYSEQVFDKLEKNHAETVFLYDMLNQKEQEIKELVHDVDVAKARLHDEWIKEYQERKGYEERAGFEFAEDKSSVYDAEIARIEEEEEQNRRLQQMYVNSEEEQLPESDVDVLKKENVKTTVEAANRNDEIIALYKEGRSMLEISKILSVGQGEVKFVIDLYKAR